MQLVQRLERLHAIDEGGEGAAEVEETAAELDELRTGVSCLLLSRDPPLIDSKTREISWPIAAALQLSKVAAAYQQRAIVRAAAGALASDASSLADSASAACLLSDRVALIFSSLRPSHSLVQRIADSMRPMGERIVARLKAESERQT